MSQLASESITRDKQDPVKSQTELDKVTENDTVAPVAPVAPVAIDVSRIKNDDLTKNDMMAFIIAIKERFGLIDFNLESYNQFVNEGIAKIIETQFMYSRFVHNERTTTEIDRKYKSFIISFRFYNVKLVKPITKMSDTNKVYDTYPNDAKMKGHSYSAPLMANMAVNITAVGSGGQTGQTASKSKSGEEVKVVKSFDIPSFNIGSFPIMVKSDLCNTLDCTRETLKSLGEDPSELGGYFIAKNQEIVVISNENIKFNTPHIHKAIKPNEFVRCEFISQPGGAFDNSSSIKIKYMTNGQILLEIHSTKFADLKIPFAFIYRIFGMTSDKDIMNTIVLNVDAANEFGTIADMSKILEKALITPDNVFEHLLFENNREKIIQAIAERIKNINKNSNYHVNENAIQYININLLDSLDNIFLPHMGKTADARMRKLKYFGMLIYETLLVHLGQMPPSNRDNLKNKRIHTAGISVAKEFKKIFNSHIIFKVYSRIKSDLKTNSFDTLTEASLTNSIKTTIANADLNKAMEQTLTSSVKKDAVSKVMTPTRVSSRLLERKNPTNTFSDKRMIVSQSTTSVNKQTKRAQDQRSVDASYIGMIDPSQSPDTGVNVGMPKALACTAGITMAGDANKLKIELLSDPSIIDLDVLTNEEVFGSNYSGVYVNGEWIGYTKNSYAIAQKYRLMRRRQEIDVHTTIYVDPITSKLEFWMDVGRIWRPVLIVYNNIDAYVESYRSGKTPIEFVQNILLTKNDVHRLKRGELTAEDLVEMGYAEYLTSEEIENCLIAKSIIDLRIDRNNDLMQYTHCEVEQAIFGVVSLSSPYSNFTQAARLTLGTCHTRQAGSWYATNFPYRLDKNRFFQYNIEMPISRTIVHDWILPGGYNTIIAYMSFGGDNQEDSGIINQAATERNYLSGIFVRYEIVLSERGDRIGRFEMSKVKNYRANARYENLDMFGYIKIGTIVNYGDVLVSRVTDLHKSKKANDGILYSDRSIIYKNHEPAIVVQIYKVSNVNTPEVVAFIKLQFERPLRVGDKISSRSGNKSIIALTVPQSAMPFSETGLIPTLIISPHSFPTRMAIGQLKETMISKVCAMKGIFADATCFLPTDQETIEADLIKYGFRYNGTERMYNGRTGSYFNSSIFFGSVFTQRLLKFVLDDEQSVGDTGPTDATTGQPLRGKQISGGLRCGEMEQWAITGHGSIMFLYEKMSQDSDGRKIYVCRCGQYGVYNELSQIYNCVECGSNADLAVIESSKSAVLFREELAACGVNMRLGLEPRSFEKYSV